MVERGVLNSTGASEVVEALKSSALTQSDPV